MKWLLKASVQKGLSTFPFAEYIYYRICQRMLSGTLPRSQSQLEAAVHNARKHLQYFSRTWQGNGSPETATFFEFGAGWDLVGPLVYSHHGVKSQVIVDIREGVRSELVLNSMVRLSHNFEFTACAPSSVDNFNLQTELSSKGIRYCAPIDLMHTGFADETFDFISNTSTLEHIPRSELPGILRECFRLLKRHGVMSCLVDLTDHYSSFDNSISCYNFLKYPEGIWRLINSPLHFQNRLRHPEYVRLFQDAGFQLVTQDLVLANASELEALRSLRIASSFERFSLAERGVKSAWIVLRKNDKNGGS